MKKPFKAATICYVLLMNGPAARISIMKTVHVLEKSKLPFKETSNQGYFLVSPPGWHCHDAARSVLVKGLVQKVGKNGNTLIYDLTPKGRKLALEAAKYYGY
jgi:hypothetical protein